MWKKLTFYSTLSMWINIGFLKYLKFKSLDKIWIIPKFSCMCELESKECHNIKGLHKRAELSKDLLEWVYNFCCNKAIKESLEVYYS